MIKLLGTSGCHLCDVAEKLVRRMAPELGIELKKLDIATSDALVEQYGISIPVLQHHNGRELFWPFDDEQLRTWFNSLS